jgi:hypothetical protein
MARAFDRGERIAFEDVSCELALLDMDHQEIRALGRQPSRMSWSTEWSIRILEPRVFDLTAGGAEAWHVAIFGDDKLMFVLPIIGGPRYTGMLEVG